MNDDGWKVNHNALPAPADGADGGTDLTAPATVTEEEGTSEVQWMIIGRAVTGLDVR